MKEEIERKKLAVEIFEITGQKVELDDPVVTAALFYSHYMRKSSAIVAEQIAHQSAQSAQEIVKKLEVTVENCVAELALAVSHEREVAAQSHLAAEQAYNKVMTLVSAGSKSEISNIKNTLTAHANLLLAKIKQSGQTPNTGRWYVSTVAAVICAVLIGATGAVAGVTFYDQRGFSPEDTRLLSMGRDMSKVIPYLDKESKDRLAKLVKEHARKD